MDDRIILQEKFIATLVGLACGDAVGTTLEFKAKGTFEPINDMVGGGPFNLEKGQWTDDTSMALCLAKSLLENNGFNAKDQMQKYCAWRDDGYMSSNGKCFDIGITVSNALEKYNNTGEAFSGSPDPYSSGNGSIMRLAPIPIFYSTNRELAIKYAGESSKTTHGSEQCIDACKLFCELILNAATSTSKQSIFEDLPSDYCQELRCITDKSFINFEYDALTGSGYVIESLISALWCFYHSESFEEAVLKAANLGNDADTTAAICGQIAGAYYGLEAIPLKWRQTISFSQEITTLANELYLTGKTLHLMNEA